MVNPSESLDIEFKRVVKQFESSAALTPEEVKCFRVSTLDDIKAAVISIEKKLAGKRTLVFLRRIEPFISTIIEFGKIVEVFLNVSDILAFVWVST